MFDTHDISATPAWARRLLEIRKFTSIELPQEIVDLAEQGRITTNPLQQFDVQLDDIAMHSLQYVLDWNCRAMVIGIDDLMHRKVAAAAIRVREPSSIVLFTNPNNYGAWARLIRAIWPTDSISVYGNTRYAGTHGADEFPEGVVYEDRPNISARWQITSYGSFIYHDVLARKIPDMLVVDELTDRRSVNYRWSEALASVFMEVPQLLLLQNANRMASSDSDTLTALQTPGSDAYMHLMWLLGRGIAVGSQAAAWLGESQHCTAVMQHLTNAGYQGANPLALTALLGTSLHLMNTDPLRPLRFHDTTVSSAVANGLSNATVRRYLEHVTAVHARASASSADELVSRLDTQGPATRDYLAELKNATWASLKASHVQKVHSQLSTRHNRTLILANSQALVRGIRMRLQAEMPQLANGDQSVARYLHPLPDWQLYASEIPPPIRTVLYTDLSEVNEHVLRGTDYLILAEWPDDREMHDLTVDLARTFNIKLVYTTLSGTFEHALESLMLD